MKMFTCSLCKEEYESEPEKTHAERRKNFPNIPLDDCCIVCTDCFVAVMSFAEKEGLHKDPDWKIGYEDYFSDKE